MILHLCQLFQRSFLITALNNSIWASTIVEIIHFIGFFLLVGSSTIINLRILGVAARHQPLRDLSTELFPWTWTGLGLAVATGFLQFGADATEYYNNIVFYRKLEIILVAFVVTVFVYRITHRDHVSVANRIMALSCLLLWVGAILAGVDVPAFTGVG